MPWPFRRHRSDGSGAGTSSAPAANAPAAAPFTHDDLAGVRRLTARPGSWQSLDPLRPAATGAAAPIVSSSASFIAHLAGTQPLVSDASLREVSAEGPRGVSYGLARPLPGEPAPPAPPPSGPAIEPAAEASVSAENYAAQDVTRRPVVASGPPAHTDLTSYVGDLQPAEWKSDALDQPYLEAALAGDEGREELPPPIFSTLLAERTGRDLAELRPDLAGVDADGSEFEDADGPTAGGEGGSLSGRRHSLAESRRLGLGAPLPSRPLDVGHHERVEPPEPEPIVFELPEPESPPVMLAPPEPARRAVAHYRRAEVPPGVRSDVTRALGRDPGPVSIRRDEEASSVAARIGARAFTRAGEVFLPMETGPLDAPETRAVLAHELTHAVQHRVYGGNLPRTSSAEGRRLEAEAHAVERYVRGDDPTSLVAPLRTLRATAGDPRIDSGGFVRSVTEQLVARGAAQWDEQGSLVFRPPDAADEEWRAPTVQDSSLQIAMDDENRATSQYGLTRGASTTADDDRRENDRHLQFVHSRRADLEGAGGAVAADAQASLQYEQNRSATADAQAERQEFERHLNFVNTQGGGGNDQPEINLVSGGLGTAFGLTSSLFASYDEVAEERATHYVAEGHTAAFTWGSGSSPSTPGAARTSGTPHTPGATGTTATTGTTAGTGTGSGSTPSTPASTPTSTPASTPTSTTGAGAGARATPSLGGTEGHWEDDDEIHIAEGGFGAALGLTGNLFAAYDQDLSKDAHFTQHWVEPAARGAVAAGTAALAAGAATPATTAATTAATTQPTGAAAGAAVAQGAHHELDAPGTRARERAISGTDPTDVVSHLDDQDLEDLATMLFERLQTRLRRDLIIDRERSGFLTDFR
jgi:hypothetical protein